MELIEKRAFTQKKESSTSGEGMKDLLITVEESGTIDAALIDVLESIKEKIRQPLDSKKLIDASSFTMHRVDSKLRDGNESTYTPQLVSIGPYHYGNENFREMQDVKFEYLNDLIQRNSEDRLPQYIAAVSRKSSELQQYSGDYNLEIKEFVEMMVVDGCFLLELLLKSYLNDRKDHASIVKMKMPLLMNDLLLVENQIPFFVLTDLLEEYQRPDSKRNKENSFSIEVLTLFCFTGDKFGAQKAAKNLEGKSFRHLLHLYHSFIDPDLDRSWKLNLEIEKIFSHEWDNCLGAVCFGICYVLTISLLAIVFLLGFVITKSISIMLSKLWDWMKKLLLLPLFWYIKVVTYTVFDIRGGEGQWTAGIPNARYLRNTGFKFKRKDTSCFLDVTRSGRTFKIPALCIQNITTIHFKNLIAFECSSRELYGQQVIAYAKFMDYLIDTEEDVAILRECDIIDNRLGKDEEVATFFNNLLNGIPIKDDDVPMYPYVQKYYTNGYYWIKFFQWRRKLIPEYFSNPWAVPSMIAAFILLVLTMAQTFYTIYPYYHPR